MNKKDISEIRRRFAPEANAISCIRGCYVNGQGEVVSQFRQPLLALPQEEAEKYLAIFKRTLSGTPGQNLIDIGFTTGQVMAGEEHKRLMALRETALLDDEIADAFFRKVIDSLRMEGNYLILLAHDVVDVYSRPSEESEADEPSNEVFPYILCSVCPVKPSKPALRYFAEENEFHARETDYVVAAPELGFLFPAFEERGANIHGALYYTRDTEENHEEFIDSVFHTQTPMPAAEQRDVFRTLLQDSLEEDCSYDVVQTVNEQLRDMIEEQKADKEAEPLKIGKREVGQMLKNSGVPEERVAAFEERYEQEFGETGDVSAVNLVNAKQVEVRTPNVVIRVDAEHSDLIETRVIDGTKYILIRADEGVEVNGVGIRITQ